MEDHIKGKMIYSILNDNDNNITFNESIKSVNYCNADYLRILLNFIIDSGKYKVIETKIIKNMITTLILLAYILYQLGIILIGYKKLTMMRKEDG